MPRELEIGAAAHLTPGTVVGEGPWAVGNDDGERFAVTRRCRHFGADLGEGALEAVEGQDGACLVCPWHGAAYDHTTGRMVRGPQGIFAKVPGLGLAFKALTRVLPLGRGEVEERDGVVVVTHRRRVAR